MKPSRLRVPPDLGARLFDRALLRGSFVLRSGAVSDRYFDKYRVTTDAVLLRAVAQHLAAQLEAVDASARLIVAPELGAVPLATALSLECGLPFAIVRDEARSRGTGRQIEGGPCAGARAVLLEDVVTSGSAAIAALEAAREAGADIRSTLCLLDRHAGGGAALAAAGAPLTSLLDADDLDAAFRRGAGTVHQAEPSVDRPGARP